MAQNIYVVWDRKNGVLLPGSHADATAANNYIAKRKGRDRGNNEQGKTYDAIQVTVP